MLKNTLAAQLLRLLHDYGIRVAFGIPGNHTLDLYAALPGSNIRHVTVRHEQAAGFAADGYARVTGKPAACFLISGPGLTNAATAMAQALADSIPMLVISSVAPTHQLGRRNGTLHELPDQQALASQIALRSHTVREAAELPGIVHAAFQSFISERPGPIHIEIPLDVWPVRIERNATAKPLAQPPQAPVAEVESACDTLRSAKDIILIAGGGANNASNFVALAERLGAPVMTTANAKGLIPSNHPLGVNGSPSVPALREAINQADAVLAVGTEFGETDYDLLMDGGELKPTGTVIRIDIDPAAGGDLVLTGDARRVIGQLLAVLKHTKPRDGQTRSATLRELATEHRHFHPDYQAVFDAIATALPDATLVGDSTQPTYYAAWQWRANRPRSYFHSVSGYGTLGYAIPAAIGAQFADPERPVIALIGDGGAQFSFAEFATAADYQLPTIFIVWNNSGYQEIEHSMTARNIPTDTTEGATRVMPPDFLAIADACRCDAHRARSVGALQDLLRDAWESKRTTVLVLEQDDFINTPSGQWYGDA